MGRGHAPSLLREDETGGHVSITRIQGMVQGAELRGRERRGYLRRLDVKYHIDVLLKRLDYVHSGRASVRLSLNHALDEIAQLVRQAIASWHDQRGCPIRIRSFIPRDRVRKCVKRGKFVMKLLHRQIARRSRGGPGTRQARCRTDRFRALSRLLHGARAPQLMLLRGRQS